MNASNEVRPTVAAFTSRDHLLFVNGEWRPAASGETLTTENPATGQVLGRFAAGRKVDTALIRANAASPQEWPSYGLDYTETRDFNEEKR